MKKVTLFFTVCMLSISFIQAQNAPRVSYNTSTQSLSADALASRGDYRMHEAYKKLATSLDKELYYDDSKIEGSRYFNDKFLPGKAIINGEPEDLILPLRYDAYSDRIEIQNGDEIEILVEDAAISCTILNSLYVYQKYTEAKNEEKGYLQVLKETEKATLYLQQKVKFREAKPAKTSHGSSFPAAYISTENYFVKLKESEITVEFNKKEFLNHLSKSNASSFKDYIKKQHINFSSKTDVDKAFNYLNTLL